MCVCVYIYIYNYQKWSTRKESEPGPSLRRKSLKVCHEKPSNPCVIMENSDIFSDFLTLDFNKCIVDYIFPELLKLANITPVQEQKAAKQKAAKINIVLRLSCQTDLKYRQGYYLNKWLNIMIHASQNTSAGLGKVLGYNAPLLCEENENLLLIIRNHLLH